MANGYQIRYQHLGPMRRFLKSIRSGPSFWLKKFVRSSFVRRAIEFKNAMNVVVVNISSQIAKTPGSISIRHRSDSSASYWYLTVDRRVSAIWVISATVASFTKEVNPRLPKRPLVFNGRLANRGLTYSVKEATVTRCTYTHGSLKWCKSPRFHKK